MSETDFIEFYNESRHLYKDGSELRNLGDLIYARLTQARQLEKEFWEKATKIRGFDKPQRGFHFSN